MTALVIKSDKVVVPQYFGNRRAEGLDSPQEHVRSVDLSVSMYGRILWIMFQKSGAR